MKFNLPHLIKHARANSNLTQQELSNKTGIPVRTLSAFENGEINNPPFNKIKKICKALKIDMGDLDRLLDE